MRVVLTADDLHTLKYYNGGDDSVGGFKISDPDEAEMAVYFLLADAETRVKKLRAIEKKVVKQVLPR